MIVVLINPISHVIHPVYIINILVVHGLFIMTIYAIDLIRGGKNEARHFIK